MKSYGDDLPTEDLAKQRFHILLWVTTGALTVSVVTLLMVLCPKF